mmetsp:Transcript_47928/g.145761  ORF Transcript_47928/g.145761 Transcript_47928/m.145761 type:complete len:201 (-) Transcript_47928:1653-2255(-)
MLGQHPIGQGKRFEQQVLSAKAHDTSAMCIAMESPAGRVCNSRRHVRIAYSRQSGLGEFFSRNSGHASFGFDCVQNAGDFPESVQVHGMRRHFRAEQRPHVLQHCCNGGAIRGIAERKGADCATDRRHRVTFANRRWSAGEACQDLQDVAHQGALEGYFGDAGHTIARVRGLWQASAASQLHWRADSVCLAPPRDQTPRR